MSDVWLLTGVLVAINFAVKATGPVLAGQRTLPPVLRRLIDASVPGLVAGLIVTGTFAAGSALTLDARAGGVVAAAAAVLWRAPLIVVVIAAAATTALLRAF